MVSSEMASTIPTIRRQATMVSAINIISRYSNISYRDLLRTGKPGRKRIYDWTDEQIENPVNSRANMPSIQRSV